MKERTLADVIAAACDALRRVQTRDEVNPDWEDRWEDEILWCRGFLPSGSGFDSGCSIDRLDSGLGMVRINTAFHHMDEHGGYDGWTEHVIRARPSFHLGLTLSISGQNRNGIKDYIRDVFHHALGQTACRVVDGKYEYGNYDAKGNWIPRKED